MAENKTEMQKKESAEIIQFDPSIFEEDAGMGVENMGQDDLALPFIKILEALSTELDNLPTAQRGDLYNSVTGEVYKGKDGIKVVPVAYQRRFLQWAPRGEGTGAPVAIFKPGDKMPETKRSDTDSKDYVQDGSGTYIEETHQHFVIVLHEDGSAETALIAMKSTQLKKSRKLNSMISSLTVEGKNGRFTPPRFSHIYLFKTTSEENAKGKWSGWEFSRVGPIEDKALYIRAKEFAASITAGEVDVKHEQADAEVSKPPF